MVITNKQKIIIGSFLIIMGLLAALSVFYIAKVEPELKAREKARLAKLKNQSAKVQQRAEDLKSNLPATQAKSVQTVQKSNVSQPAKPADKAKATPAVGTSVSSAPPVKPMEKQDPSDINMDKLIEKAKQVYSPQELTRKEGTLWIDRKAGKATITLGALQGLSTGKSVSVYEGDKKIGQVMIDTAYDVISYVHPVGISMEQLSKGYYRAVIE